MNILSESCHLQHGIKQMLRCSMCDQYHRLTQYLGPALQLRKESCCCLPLLANGFIESEKRI